MMNTLNKRSVQGFTLVELMIAVMIIAILVAVALPNYRRYAERTSLAHAKQLIVSAKQKVEAERLINPRGFDVEKHIGTRLAVADKENTKYKFTYNYNKKNDGSLFIQAAPLTGYKYGVWLDEGGIAYRCEGLSGKAPIVKPANCERM